MNDGGAGLTCCAKDLRNELSEYTTNTIHQQMPLLLEFKK